MGMVALGTGWEMKLQGLFFKRKQKPKRGRERRREGERECEGEQGVAGCRGPGQGGE